MTDDLVRLPTQDGDFYVRPSLVHSIEDDGAECWVYWKHGDILRRKQLTCDAATAAAILQGAPAGEVETQ